MILYSKKIILFVQELKGIIKSVLSSEIGVRVERERFYNLQQTASYPISIVIYDNRSMLGYFDPTFYELGFHRCLMRADSHQLYSVVRHELAHYMTFIQHGPDLQPHSTEFKRFCQSVGWGEEVSRATLCLEGGQNGPDPQESATLRKVQKLMSLASSANENEAQAAMIKSQQLLLKHNMESKDVFSQDEETIHLRRVLKQKREDAKMRAIAKILDTFFVSTVYHRAVGWIYLEILGNAVNVEIAEYVAHVLQIELDRLWEAVCARAHLKGAVAKNSFFLGLAKGYCNKIQSLKRDYQAHVSHALIVIEKQLIDARAMAYPRLSSVKSGSRNHCQHSSALGEQVGRELSINVAINKSSSHSEALIAHQIKNPFKPDASRGESNPEQ